MTKEWEKNLLKASEHRNENEKYEEEFLKLVDEVFDSCSLDVARVLMKTFSAEPDYGTQERVVSVLAGLEHKILIQVILEELPRLVEEAPEHAEDLLAIAIKKDLNLLQKQALQMDNKVKNALRNLICNKDFVEFYPEAELIKV